MKIGIFSNMGAVPWGASEELWSLAARALQHRGCHIAANYKHWSPHPERLLELQRCGAHLHWRYRTEKIVQNVKRSLGCRRLHHAWLRREKPDFVLINSAALHCDMAIAIDCQEAGIPYAVLLHGADPRQAFPAKKIEGYRRAYARAAHCFFVSAGLQRIVERLLIVRLPRWSVVETPLHLSGDFVAPWNPPDPVWRLACVGRLDTKVKGQDLILQVLSEDKWRRRPLQVHFWGDTSGDIDYLRQLARLYQVETQIAFRGFSRDLPALWKSHHALLLPSHHEGVPLVTVEAMWSGRIPIVTRVGRNDEFVEDGETGFLIPAASPRLLDETLERAWQQRHRWSSMGKLAAERIRKCYPQDPVTTFVEQLLDCAHRALSFRGTRSADVSRAA